MVEKKEKSPKPSKKESVSSTPKKRHAPPKQQVQLLEDSNKPQEVQPNQDETNILQVLTTPGIADMQGVIIQGHPDDQQQMQQAIEEDRLANMPYYPLTDMGNAERLVYWHGADLKYCHEWGKSTNAQQGWLVWTGKRWAMDENGSVMRRAKHTTRSIAREADPDRTDNAKIVKAIIKHAHRSEGAGMLHNMIKLTQSEPSIPITTSQMDNNQWLFNCKNGLIDLRNGTISAHDRRALCTKMARVDFDKQAKAPRWHQFLQEIFAGDHDLIDWIQRAVGYSLSGVIREQCFFVCWGDGANGKSTFFKVLQKMMGKYGTTAEMRTFISGEKKTGPRDDLAHLHGARFVTASEAEKGSKLAESFIKEVTGGDRVVARHLYGNLFEFHPVFKLWLATNHLPRITGTDKGIWRRVRLIPFEISFEEEKQDKDLDLALFRELPGILAWAVQGCLNWQKHGLAPPEKVLFATHRIKERMDVLAEFLHEACILGEKIISSSTDLHAHYAEWAQAQGVSHPFSMRGLASELENRGFQKEKCTYGEHKDKMVWLGIKPKKMEDTP